MDPGPKKNCLRKTLNQKEIVLYEKENWGKGSIFVINLIINFCWEKKIYYPHIPFSIIVDFMGHLEEQLRLKPLILLIITMSVSRRTASATLAGAHFPSRSWKVAKPIFPNQDPASYTTLLLITHPWKHYIYIIVSICGFNSTSFSCSLLIYHKLLDHPI